MFVLPPSLQFFLFSASFSVMVLWYWVSWLRQAWSRSQRSCPFMSPDLAQRCLQESVRLVLTQPLEWVRVEGYERSEHTEHYYDVVRELVGTRHYYEQVPNTRQIHDYQDAHGRWRQSITSNYQLVPRTTHQYQNVHYCRSRKVYHYDWRSQHAGILEGNASHVYDNEGAKISLRSAQLLTAIDNCSEEVPSSQQRTITTEPGTASPFPHCFRPANQMTSYRYHVRTLPAGTVLYFVLDPPISPRESPVIRGVGATAAQASLDGCYRWGLLLFCLAALSLIISYDLLQGASREGVFRSGLETMREMQAALSLIGQTYLNGTATENITVHNW